jgi:hypothetical protein
MEIHCSDTVGYIQASPRDQWIMTDIATQTNVIGAVVFKTEKYRFYFGRANETVDGRTYQVFGKVHFDFHLFGMWYWSPAHNRGIHLSAGYEILVCV